MDLVVLHSPYHLFIFKEYLLKRYLKKNNTILLIYPYQGINLSVDNSISYKTYKGFANSKIKNISIHSIKHIIIENKETIDKNKQLMDYIFSKYCIEKLYVFTDNTPFYNSIISLSHKKGVNEKFLVEDGLIHYCKDNIKGQIMSVLKTIAKFLLGYGKQKFLGYGTNKLINNHICFNPSMSRFKIHSLPLTNLKKDNKQMKVSKKVIYISQPLSEISSISTTDELHLINTLYETVQNEGYEFFIKPHPRDDNEKFKYISKENIIEDNNVAEVLVTEQNAIALAVTSTSVFNLVNVFNYPNAYYIYDIFKIEPNIKSILKRMPSRNIIKDTEHLRSILSNKKMEF